MLPLLLPILLYLVLAPNLWAAEPPRALAWAEMVPAHAKPLGQLLVSHDGGETGPRMAQTLTNAPVVAELEGQTIKLPGYMVPLSYDTQQRVTEFLLVPYFGACIHVPPPPSNQIVYVQVSPGVVQEALYQPFWIEGPLKVQQTSSELAETGYFMQANRVYPYELPKP